MKHLHTPLFMSALFFYGACFATEDVSEKIAIGLTREAVQSLLGGNKPDTETCTSYVGVSSCTLIFTKGNHLAGKTQYTVSLLANRVVSVKTSKQSGMF